jgi:class 3 adenylate cyclase/tetratricopeptide (TPR) repeat protein
MRMDFYAVLDQILTLLQQRGRVSYRALKRQFDLDDAYLDDLKTEIIEVQQYARDEGGSMLVWLGATSEPSAPAPMPPAQTPLAYTPLYLAEKILTSRSALEGERKQVTVLFADLKGSTELIHDLDPEAAQQLLEPALQHMMDAVHRFEGTVNQVMGDGIMALFGAPIAHEDHVLRACYAALAMQTGLRRYAETVRRSHGLEVQMRVGLNAGDVVVRTIGNDLHMDYSAVGQTTHLAARMEQLALPGTIRLPASTLRLVEGLVRVSALGPMPVRGISEPVEVFELLGATPVRRRLQAAVARGLTRFVGRDQEMETLTYALAQAAQGQGQLVALIGEAGVGKSRLVYESVHSHATQGWRVLESVSASYGRATPYFPVLDLLKRYAHVDDADDARTIRAKVTGQVLTLDEALQDTLPALLALLDALPDDSPFRQIDPAQRRQRTLTALTRVLLRESQVQPLLLVFEDLHWIDSETQALLDSLVESLPTASLMLLVNYRPEYQHSWSGKAYYTQLQLDPLPPTSVAEILQALLGDDASLAPLTPLLITRTAGNPFFLEESVRALAEAGELAGERGAYRLTQPLHTIQVPATVQAVLAARIDRLPSEAKRLLQTAAVIGTEVPWSLLHAIADSPEVDLYRNLAHLNTADFLHATRLFPEHEYTFKHALTHEVAYGSLLLERRRALHARIVETIEELAGERVAEQGERLAHHALRGEVWDKALLYCRQTGEKALARSAHREAVGYFEHALHALEHLPVQGDTRAQALDLRLALRSALLPSGDSRRILATLREAEALAVALDDQRRLGQISGFLSVHFRNMGAYDQAVASAQRALTLMTADGDTVIHALANLYLGAAHWAQGDYLQAIDCLTQTVAALHGAQRRERLGQANLPSVQALAFLTACHAELGRFPEGRALGEEGLQIAETVAHPSSLMWASYGLGLLACAQGDLPSALPLLERAMRICREADLSLFVPRVAAALGAAYTLSGQASEAVTLLSQARVQTMAADMAGFQTLCSLPLAAAHLLAGHIEEAHTYAEQTRAFAQTHQERSTLAYTLRLLGAIAAQHESPKHTLAEMYYRQALALATTLGMRPLQAHCRLSLGTLYLQMSAVESAREALTAATTLYRALAMPFWLSQTEAACAHLA